MTGAAALLLAVLIVLAAAYVPGYLAIRLLAGSRLLALGLAPGIGAAVAGIGAIIAPFLGLDWTLLTFAGTSAVLLLAALVLARCGVRLPSTVLDGPLVPPGSLRTRLAWAGALVAALAVSIVPIAVKARSADAVLERYDTLYHLTAIAWIRSSGDGSSLTLNAIASSSRTAASYPAAFHDLAALVPVIDIPIVLNASVLALGVVPWVLGAALLARTAFPAVSWAPPAVALVAVLIPASPIDLWIHLSPIPNLTGFAAMSGAVAAAVALWQALVVPGERPSPRAVIAALAAVCLAGIGLTLMQPNVGVTAGILIAVVTLLTALAQRRERPWLFVAPVIGLLPAALLTYTPLGSRVTNFSGGLSVPWWSALGEVGLGLLTVWPMALGVIIALLWWPGLVRTLRTSPRWVGVAWIVMAIMYLDAAVDSPLNLSVLYFRGQDRLSIPLAMLSAMLVVPGLQAWAGLLRRVESLRAPGLRRPIAAVLVVLAATAALTSVPARLDKAALNLDEVYPGRGRFLQADEMEEFAAVASQIDPDESILASPYSGAAHMFALYGLTAYFPVAGVALTDADRAAIAAVPLAGSDPEQCQALLDQGIGYVYQERILYQYDPAFTAIGERGDDLGTVVFETDHSRLIRIECDPA